MEEHDFKEITNRLYKFVKKGNYIYNKAYRVRNERYDFDIKVSESNKLILIESRKGEFNTINKIIQAIPYLIYVKEHKY